MTSWRDFVALLSACALAGAAAPDDARAQALSLQQARTLAHDSNPDLRLAALAHEAATAAITVAGAAPNPVLTVQSFNLNPHAGIGAGSLRSKTVDSAVRLDQLFERAGKRGLRIDNATGLAAASAFDVVDARRQLDQLVGQAYYELLAASERLQIYRDSAVLFDHTVAAARLRSKAGDLAGADVARAQVDALRAHNDLLQATSAQRQARLALALLIGQPQLAEALMTADGWPLNPPADPADELAADPADSTLRARPDVRAAQARVQAAESARKMALAARSADITVGVQLEHFPASAANGQGSGNSVGIALQIPLMVRYAYQGEVRAADVALEAACERLRQARLQARGDIDGARERVRSSGAMLRSFDASSGVLTAARRSADAAEFAFQHGALGIMELLDARRSYRAVQLEALTARAAYASALAQLQAALSQGPTP